MRRTMRTLIGIVVAAALGGTALVGASYADGDEGFDDHGGQGVGMRDLSRGQTRARCGTA